jgi:hypothetical protein
LARILSDEHPSKIIVRLGQGEDEAGIQPAKLNGIDLFDGPQGLEVQLHVRLPAPEPAKGVWNHSMPGEHFHKPDSQHSRLAGGYPLGAHLRLINVLQNTSCIAQVQFPCCGQFHSPRQPVE